MAHHHTILAQLLKWVPRFEFEKLSNQYDQPHRSDALSRWSQFVALVIGHIGQRSSLRDIEAALAAQPTQNYHLGIQSVSRSSLARANKKRDPEFFRQLFASLYQRCQQSPSMSKKPFRFKSKLFSLDGSLIDLSLKVFPWADIAPRKAAFKLHVGLDHDGLIPAFATVTEGLDSEMAVAEAFQFPAGSVLVFDRGYSRYTWHKQLSDKGLFWVTRARSNMKYDVLKDLTVDEKGDVLSDQIIRLSGKKAMQSKLSPIRRVEYFDRENNKRYVFITNQKKWSAQTIADIYKSRWEIELFFKWIKQNLKIKTFLGHTFYSVATQIYVALCVYLLMAYLKFLSKSQYSVQVILKLIQLNLFQRLPIDQLLQRPKAGPPDPQQAFNLRFA
jgi:hypothetical protein